MPSHPTAIDHQVLLDVALQFGATLDLERLLPLVLERMVSLLGAERAMFALFDADGRIERDIGHNLERSPGSTPPVSITAINAVLKSETWFNWDDSEEGAFASNLSVRRARLKFVLAVPVSVRQRVAGVLYVDSSAPVTQLVNHKWTLEALARLVGTAVENAQLFEEQQFRAAWLGQLAHDLRSPLAVVSMCGSSLQETEGLGAEFMELADDIKVNAAKMIGLIQSTLHIVEASDNAELIRPVFVDIPETLRGSARTVRLLARHLKHHIVVANMRPLPPAHTIEDRLDVVLDNLLFNALKYSEEGGAITLSAKLRSTCGPSEAMHRPIANARMFRRAHQLCADPNANFVEVSVHNLGREAPTRNLDDLFRAFVRGPDMGSSLRSSGLGLAIVDQCVRSMGGCVWIESSPETGFLVSFTLPTRLLAEPA